MNSEVRNPEFKARLSELVGEEDPFTWARGVGIPSATFSRIWNEGTVPKSDHLVRIAESENVSLDWLLRGLEPTRADDDVRSLQEAPAIYDVQSLPDGFVLLPKYEVRAAAGDGALVHSEQIVDHLAFKHDWIVRQLRRNPVYLILIEAMGNSMVPTIGDRDLLLVDTSDAQLRDNAIYALSLNGDVVVKRLERRMNGAVRVISDNRDNYDPYELGPDEADELRIIGQVVWHGGKL